MFRFGSFTIPRRIDHQSGDSVTVSEANGVRSLHLGNSTIQSAMRIKMPYDLELSYTRGMMCYLLFCPQAREVLMLGLGGGSLAKFIWRYLPQVRVTVVEINSRVIEVARSHFLLPPDDERLRVVAGDGAAYVRESLKATVDVLMLDAYAGDGIPQALCAQDFYDSCAIALAEDGMLMVNLWGSDRNFANYLQRIERSFAGRVLVMPVGRPGNIVVMAFRRLPPGLCWETLRERAQQLEDCYPIEFLEFVGRLREHNLHNTQCVLL